MRIITLNEETKQDILKTLLKRTPSSYPKQEEQVKTILDRVREEGDKALFSYTKNFDGAEITADNIRVTGQEIADAYRQIEEENPNLLGVMKRALFNIRDFHKKQLQKSFSRL